MAVGRLVEPKADLAQVVVTLAGLELGRHDRCWARHQTITDGRNQRAAAAYEPTWPGTALSGGRPRTS